MSASFESGVKGYVHAKATIYVHFPVDLRGNEHVCCEQCPHFRDGSKTCAITKLPVLMPSKYVGYECPFERIEEEEASGIEIPDAECE